MSVLTDLQNQLGELRRDLADLRAARGADVTEISSALRKQGLRLSEAEMVRSVDRLRPPVGLVGWKPRLGEDSRPDLEQSLIDRLRRNDPVADSLGNTDMFVGQPNMLRDPTFDNGQRVGVVVDTLNHTPGARFSDATSNVFSIAYTFTSWYTDTWRLVASSGVTGFTPMVQTFERADTYGSSYAAGSAQVIGRPGSAGTHEWGIWQGLSNGPSNTPPYPYRVGAVRFHNPATDPATVAANYTVAYAFLRLWRGTTLVGETRIDLTTFPLGSDRRIWVAYPYADATERAAAFELDLGFHVECAGTPAVGANLSYRFTEPQVHHSYSPDPVPYAPALGTWHPTALMSLGDKHHTDVWLTLWGYDDTAERVIAALDGTWFYGDGVVGIDMEQSRSAAGTWQFYPYSDGGVEIQAANGLRNNLSLMVSSDTYDRLMLEGDATLTGLLMGPGTAAIDLRIRRSGTKAITADDNAGGAITLNIVGTLQQGGSGVLTAGDLSAIAGQAHTGTSGAVGTGTDVARDDHQHPARVDLGDAANSDWVVRLAKTADGTLDRLRIALDGSGNPHIIFGSGAAEDLKLIRGTTRQLILDDNAGATNPIELALFGQLSALPGTATDIAIAASVDTDTAPTRFAIKADGTIEWGGGGATRDVTLYRNAADDLRSDDHFVASGFAVPTKNGVPDDTDEAVDMSGNCRLDTANSRIYFRVGTTWKYAALT